MRLRSTESAIIDALTRAKKPLTFPEVMSKIREPHTEGTVRNAMNTLVRLERVTRESIFKPGDRWKHAHPRTLYALRRTVICPACKQAVAS